MPIQIEADGDTWRVTNYEDDRRRAVRTVVFHCVSNSQRPYRVIEVADDAFEAGDIGEVPADQLAAMFAKAHTMDYSHDSAANPINRGYGDPPLG
jgi:hypothetical protein